ncbi:MAG: hypothetical protein L0H70_05045, partial [Xanthomonadales bacterium]|nr:hypothetical protein [Xanthomonadales bacterium]
MYCEHYDTLMEYAPTPRPQRAAWRSRDLAQRLTLLPMAQPEQAIKQLTLMLGEQLSEAWPRSKRLRVVQEMLPTVRALRTSVQTQIGNMGYPLPESKAQLATAMLALLQSLGQAFAIAACELCSATGKPPWLGRGYLTTALNQALRCDHAALSLVYQLGLVPPSGLWSHLHGAYAVALSWQVDKTRWRDGAQEFETSVQDRYAQVLLLALSGPYAYQRREWPSVLAASATLAVLAELTSDGGSGIVVAADGPDSGPARVAQACTHEADYAWSVDLAPLIAVLDTAIAEADGETVILNVPGAASMDLPQALAIRVRDAWHGPIERGDQRLPGTHALATLPGLHGLHRVLAQGQHFDAFVQHLAGAQIVVGAQANAAAWMSGSKVEAGSPMIDARVLDQSLGGYRLAWPTQYHMRLKVGELIGLAPGYDSSDPATPTLCLVGIVRWLRSEPEVGLTAGVHVLAKSARAAAVRLVDADGNRGRPQRGLLVRGEEGAEVLLGEHGARR